MTSTMSPVQSPAQYPITIDFKKTDDQLVSSGFELLVVACDPRVLIDVCNYTEEEVAIFQKLEHFHFHTTLLKVQRLETIQHTVIFSPSIMGNMDGSVYVYRNETAKQFGVAAANQMEENLVTVYQLYNPTQALMSDDEFLRKLKQDLPVMQEHCWWPYTSNIDNNNILQTVSTPYFNHFSLSDIQNGLPWQLLDLQGKNKTIYVHASTCFESIVDCWAYEKLLMTLQRVQAALPVALGAPIAILGAGASGLLYAVQLRTLGYSNITIIEATDRYGGKTHTVIEDGPYPPGQTAATVCELGACYFSPSYNAMIKDMQSYLDGNLEIDFSKGDPNFRAVVTGSDCSSIVEYSAYVTEMAKQNLGIDNDLLLQAALALEMVKYIHVYEGVMGIERPMPSTPPAAFLEKYGSSSFLQLLEAENMMGLVGILQYAYEVQGYGILDKIAAFYGLVWITPEIMVAILLDALIGAADWLITLLNKYLGWNLPLAPEIPIVQAWSKGWMNMWDQIVVKENLNITENTKVISIQRSSFLMDSDGY